MRFTYSFYTEPLTVETQSSHYSPYIVYFFSPSKTDQLTLFTCPRSVCSIATQRSSPYEHSAQALSF